MKFRSILAIAALAVFSFTACEETENLGEAKVSVSPAEVTFDATGEKSEVVALTATRDWHIENKPDWVVVNPSTGKASTSEQKVTISVDPNKGNNREDDVIFTIGLAKASLHVKQAGEAGELKKGSGTLEDPYSVAGVIEYVQGLGADVQSPGSVYVKGIVSSVSTTYEASGTFGNAVFYMVDNEGDTDQFYAYQTLYLGNRKWKTGDTDIKAGDAVIIYGPVVNFKGNTPETVSKGASYLYSLNGVTEGSAPGGEETVATPSGKGTEAEPYNVAAAINAVKNLKYTDTKNYEKIDNIYVKGKISAIKDISWDATLGDAYYGNAEYSLVDEGYTAVFGVYRGYYLNGVKFTAQDQIKVGDEVLVCGSICNMFGNTPQFTTGSKIITINGEGQEVETKTGTLTEMIKVEDDVHVVVNEAVVAAVCTKGFIATDGTQNVYVFLNKAPEAKLGDKVKIEATKTTYYGLPEFKDATVTVVGGGNSIPRTELKDITSSIDSYSSSDTDYLTATGTLDKNASGYYIVKVDGATRAVSPQYLDPSIDPSALLNQRVIVTGYFNTIHSKNNYVQVIATEIKAADPNAKYCTVSTKAISAKASDTEATFTISANAAWTVTSDNAAFTVTPASGNADATVKVTFAANESDKDIVANLKLVCTDAKVEETIVLTQAAKSSTPSGKAFVKVTSAPNDWSGTYLIVNEENKVAFDGKGTADAVNLVVSVEISNGSIAANDATLASTVTVESMNGGYALKTASGKYLSGTKEKNAINFGSTQVVMTISLDSNGNAVITDSAADTWILYNANADQKRFRFYKKASTAPKAVQLYKLSE